MNSRPNVTVDLSQLKKAIDAQRDKTNCPELPVNVIIPLCIGFDEKKDNKISSYLYGMVFALTHQETGLLTNPKYANVTYQFRLYKNLSPDAVKNIEAWLAINKSIIDLLDDGKIILDIPEWRKSHASARLDMQGNLERFVGRESALESAVAKEFHKRWASDASAFVKRKNSIDAQQREVLIKQAKAYIWEEIIDCLVSLPPATITPDSGVSIFLYPDALYSSMKYVLKDDGNPQALGRSEIIMANYTLNAVKDEKAEIPSVASTKPLSIPPRARSISGGVQQEQAAQYLPAAKSHTASNGPNIGTSSRGSSPSSSGGNSPDVRSISPIEKEAEFLKTCLDLGVRLDDVANYAARKEVHKKQIIQQLQQEAELRRQAAAEIVSVSLLDVASNGSSFSGVSSRDSFSQASAGSSTLFGGNSRSAPSSRASSPSSSPTNNMGICLVEVSSSRSIPGGTGSVSTSSEAFFGNTSRSVPPTPSSSPVNNSAGK